MADEVERLRVYRYAAAPEAADYVAIMRRFTGALLADWSARDLLERGLDLRPAVVDDRLRYLAANGNLMESPREVRVTSIAEYQRQPARYTVTTIGAQVHRQVEEVLAATGGAREVPRELLDAVAAGLERLAADARAGGDVRHLAELVSTVFLQFEAFATAVADFYSYVGAVLARPDLDGDEWLGFKGLLLDYLETIVRGVALRTPTIRRGLARLEPHLDHVLDRIGAIDPDIESLRAASAEAGAIRRARGRSRGDWDELRGWFGETSDRDTGAAQLRTAAGRAVGTLLTHLKRLNAAGSREESMRRHLLKLAGWFDAATTPEAHDLFTSAFALYSARHLSVELEPEVAEAVPATASWWTAPPAPVAVSIRERGDRVARGRSVRVADHSAQRARLLEERRRADDARRVAVAELAAAGDRLEVVRLSADAFAVFLELLAAAAAGRGTAERCGQLPDAAIELVLRPALGSSVVRGAAGSLTLHDQVAEIRSIGDEVVIAMEAGG